MNRGAGGVQTPRIATKMVILRKKTKKKKQEEIVTYWLLPWRQALSIPGDDIMVSVRWLEFGFWLL